MASSVAQTLSSRPFRRKLPSGRKLLHTSAFFLRSTRTEIPVAQSLFTMFVIAFVLSVAIGDLLWQRIPRHFAAAAFAVGIAYHIIFGGFVSAVLASLIGFAVGVIFFRMGAVGGGDVKLLAAIGALLGLSLWGRAMFIAVLVAAALAIVTAFAKGALVRTMRNSLVLLATFPSRGFGPHETIHLRSELAIRAPFGVAAAAGTLFALFRP